MLAIRDPQTVVEGPQVRWTVARPGRNVRGLGISEHEIDAVAARELQELARRDRLYRGDRQPLDVGGRTVILVDEELATGATMRAAVQALRQQQPARIVATVPTPPTPVRC
jgi:putative phosphoribosyl transferase